MRTRSALALVVGYPLLGGCVQGPPLQYTSFSDGGGTLQGDYSGLTKFTLARSLILVQASKGQAPLVTSIPTEAIGDSTDFGVRQLPGASYIALQVTKRGDSNLVRSLALGPAGGIQPINDPGPADAATEPARVPGGLAVAIDTQALLVSPTPGATTVTGLAQGDSGELAFSVTFTPVPVDAIPSRALDLKRAGGLYFYSACRTATVTFLNPPLARQAYTVTVADPNFVQTVAVGPGRTIASHAACGVDVLAGTVAGLSAAGPTPSMVAFARGLNARWGTRVMTGEAAAITVLKPQAPAKANRRKGKPAIAARATPPAPVSAAPEVTPAPVDGPLRNTQIRVPAPRPGESYAF